MIFLLSLALTKSIAAQAIEGIGIHGMLGIVLDGEGWKTDVCALRDVEAVGKGEGLLEEAFHS